MLQGRGVDKFFPVKRENSLDNAAANSGLHGLAYTEPLTLVSESGFLAWVLDDAGKTHTDTGQVTFFLYWLTGL